jgi:hypothetical protein
MVHTSLFAGTAYRQSVPFCGKNSIGYAQSAGNYTHVGSSETTREESHRYIPFYNAIGFDTIDPT